MKDYVPHAKELHSIAVYRRALRKLIDAALVGHEVAACFATKRSFSRNGPFKHLVSIEVDSQPIWRAPNVYPNEKLLIDASEARLRLRDYYHRRAGVSIQALDYAEQVDE